MLNLCASRQFASLRFSSRFAINKLEVFSSVIKDIAQSFVVHNSDLRCDLIFLTVLQTTSSKSAILIHGLSGLSRDLHIRVCPTVTEEDKITFRRDEPLIAWKDEQSTERFQTEPDECKTVAFSEQIKLETDTHIIHLPVTGTVILS